MTFWRWEPTSPHPREDGLPRIAHISKVVFESKMVEDRLLIKPRSLRKVEPVYYRKAWQDTNGGQQVVFIADQRCIPNSRSISTEKSHQSLGSFFRRPYEAIRPVR